MLLDISIIPQTSEELFYFVTKRIPYLCGFWRFANAYKCTVHKGNDFIIFIHHFTVILKGCIHRGMSEQRRNLYQRDALLYKDCRIHMPLRYNNDKQKKPLFSRGPRVCRHSFNSFSKLKSDEKNIEKRRL